MVFKNNSSSEGFSTVELLITLFVAAAFIVAGFQLYNVVIRDSGDTQAESRASNAAYDLMRQYTDLATNPCTSQTPMNSQSVDVEGLPDASVTVSITCPYSATKTMSKIEVVISYSSPQETVRHATFVDGLRSNIAATHGSFIQDIGNSNCPTNRTRAVDARDNRTYWVQRMADGKCWMLTNLAYEGGGNNTYSDVKSLNVATFGPGSINYANPAYMASSGYTVEPNSPSTSTNGTGQYGHLYTWCAAMGGQSTAACSSSSTPAPDISVSICPSGWRLPTGGSNGELAILNNTINGGSTTSDSGLRSAWLSQRAGYILGSMGRYWAGDVSYYWSSTQQSASSVYILDYDNMSSSLNSSRLDDKIMGASIRCLV